MGAFFIFFNPPFQAPDEYMHYSRILQISDGQILPVREGNAIGAKLREDQINFLHLLHKKPLKMNEVLQLLKHSDNNSNKSTDSFSWGTTTYNPVAYTPQVLGVIFARLSRLNQAQTFYLARLFALLFFIGVVYYSIRLTPLNKWFFAVVAALPMTLFLAASNSGDVTSIGASIFVIAYFLKLVSQNRMTKKDYLFIVLSTLFIAATKAPYFLVVIFYAFIPKDKFIRPRDRLYLIIILVAVLITVNMLWSFVTRDLSSAAIGKAMYPTILSDPQAQIAYILHNPYQYAKIFIKTIWLQGTYYINTCIGALGPLKVWFNQLIYTSYVVVMTVALLGDEAANLRINKKMRLAALLLLVLFITSIITVMYITWTVPRLNIIEGVQGRYFIPVLFLLPIIAKGLFFSRATTNKVSFPLFVMIAMIGLSFLICLKFFNFYQ